MTNFNQVKLFPYRSGSQSAKALTQELGIKRIKRQNSTFGGFDKDITVINWGCSGLPDNVKACTVLNRNDRVKKMSNKLKFFRHLTLSGDSSFIPDWTQDDWDVACWIAEGHRVVVRHKLTGHSGDGIEILDPENAQFPVPIAPLYTKYIPKKHEYRIHMMGKEIIDYSQKKRNLDVTDEEVDWRIRSHANGFVYTRENVQLPTVVRDAALTVWAHCGLHFGATDVIYNQAQNRAYVLEVNTAPGLEGTTLKRYVEGFRSLLS